MPVSVNGIEAARNRYAHTSSNGQARWYTDYIGPYVVEAVTDEPQANLIEMGEHQTIVPHFHAVDQFQIMVAGSGRIGRHELNMIALHYADHHTAYGPIDAGPYGLALFTLRARSDPGAVYLDKPGYKDKLLPSKKRYLIADGIALSVPTVMKHRPQPELQSVLDAKTDTSDGLGAAMLRAGAGQRFRGPDPAASGGQYYLVLNGALVLGEKTWPLHSLIHVGRGEAALDATAGEDGLEALVLSFPTSG